MLNKWNIIVLITLFVLVDLTLFFMIIAPEIVTNYTSEIINYDFYVLMKWIVFLSSFPIMIILYTSQYKNYVVLTAIVAILFNPFYLIHLYNRDIWIIIDLLIISAPIVIFAYRRYIVQTHLREHNPKLLVKHLSNFTRDTPLKWTTHIWDFGSIKQEFGDFKGFMNKVEEKWQEIEDELKRLSPKLHAKIYSFLFASKDTDEVGWFTKDNITVGWSSLDGLEQWCNDGKDPFQFKFDMPYIIEGKHIDNFEEIINIFKKEIEIRNEEDILESLFINQKKKLGRKFKTNLIKLKGKDFYTDVESFNNVLDQIFSEIKKRESFPQINIEAVEEKNGEYVDIKIIHIDSHSNRNSKNMLTEVEDGNWQAVKESLTNLCDWSIESSYENEHYRINYLRSDRTVDEVEILDKEPKGFTHILRFYYK